MLKRSALFCVLLIVALFVGCATVPTAPDVLEQILTGYRDGDYYVLDQRMVKLPGTDEPCVMTLVGTADRTPCAIDARNAAGEVIFFLECRDGMWAVTWTDETHKDITADTFNLNGQPT